MKPSKVIALACAVAMLLTLFGCAVPATDTAAAAEPAAADSTAADKEIVYYYVGVNNNHPCSMAVSVTALSSSLAMTSQVVLAAR